MEYILKEPERQISTKIIKIWRTTNTIGHGSFLLVFGALLAASHYWDWYNWVNITLYILIGITVLSAIFSIFFEPVFIQRTWRYDVDENFIQLKHGRWNVEHTIIPMAKIEYVTTDQGPFLRKAGLYSLKIGTTASNHTIPAIPEEEALALRAQIASYANVKEDDSLG
ncbi:PH domain-containing protein [Planococcus beigongshangi]|uniref:PH domain-containing protein n=1 Tax=Planococcus beigongshangi TaxID=2782536 RepID=UPI00193C7AA1|nr:PH domain-containing protein [Planococcus beigongshangi]